MTVRRVDELFGKGLEMWNNGSREKLDANSRIINMWVAVDNHGNR